jgi:hypothetical protein
MDHVKIIADYEKGKAEILTEVKCLITDVGASQAARTTGSDVTTMSNLKNGRRDKVTSYKMLLKFKNALTGKE